MLENLSRGRIAHCLSRNHIFLLTEEEDLSADKSSCSRPREEGEECHKEVDSLICRNVCRVKESGDDEKDRESGQAHQNIADTHDDVIDNTAEIARNTAKHNSEDVDGKNGNEGNGKRNASAVHQTGEYVTAVLIGAEDVILRGCGEGVDLLARFNELIEGVGLAVFLVCNEGVGVLGLAREVLLSLTPNGIDNGTEPAEKEESDDHNKTDHRKLRAEEAARDHSAGREELDVFIVGLCRLGL